MTSGAWGLVCVILGTWLCASAVVTLVLLIFQPGTHHPEDNDDD